MEIKRDRYLNTLISKKHNGLIKVVTGMRRCGKSYLLFDLFKEHLLSEGTEASRIIEIAFDALVHSATPMCFTPISRNASKTTGCTMSCWMRSSFWTSLKRF